MDGPDFGDSPSFSEFLEAIRGIVEPVADLTDEQLAHSTDYDPPMIRLLLGLRASLREYDANAALAATEAGHRRFQ